jgi:hypothetical protein
MLRRARANSRPHLLDQRTDLLERGRGRRKRFPRRGCGGDGRGEQLRQQLAPGEQRLALVGVVSEEGPLRQSRARAAISATVV